MTSLLMVGVKKMVSNFGILEIHGVPIGEKKEILG